MEGITLVFSKDKRVSKIQHPASLAFLSPSSESPFWLDLQSPSEHLIHRISVPLKLHPRVVRACLSGDLTLGWEDYGDYLFGKSCLIKNSKGARFIKRTMKILLCSEYLISIHREHASFNHILQCVQEAGFNHTTTPLLTIFDRSIEAIANISTDGNNGKHLILNKGREHKKNPLWWRLKNMKANLVEQEKLLRHLADLGVRYFNPEDIKHLNSILQKIAFLYETIDAELFHPRIRTW